MAEPQVSVLIPAYNEVGSVGKTVERVRGVMAQAGIAHEIIVIDDGSRDGTAEEASAAGAQVLIHPKNRGYGRALKTGLRWARSERIAITDADGTYPVEVLPALLAKLPPFDMVVGARTGDHYRGSAAKWTGRKILELMVRFVSAVWVPDVNSGLRVFRKAIAIENIRRIGDGFSFTTTLTLAMLLEGHFVEYVPIEYYPRVGSTKVRMGRDMLRTLQILVMAIVAYNPIKMFLLLAYVGLLALVPSLLLDGLLAGGTHAGLIVAVVLCASLVVFALGLITDVLRRLPQASGDEMARGPVRVYGDPGMPEETPPPT